MATFSQNIKKIQGEAIYAPEMRTAIAEALRQAVDIDIDVEGAVTVALEPLQEAGDYALKFTVSE